MTQRHVVQVLFVLSVLFPGAASNAEPPRSAERVLPQKFAPTAKAEAPVILCIDDKSAPGGQPMDHAYAKAAASGFRSILTFRSSKDGVDITRERLMVEKHQLRYFNLPATAPLPSHKQIDEFLAWLRDKNNHPMLANCAYVERVAPYMMMFQMVELGWNEERAVEEASRSGLAKDDLAKFARGYFKSKSKKNFRS